MCKICGMTFCPGSCPNATEPKAESHCKKCGRPLQEGDRVLRIDSETVWCEFCVDDNIGFISI
jgi:hypothetical protein